MSYDLNFYKRKTDAISKADIENYLSIIPNVNKENDTRWFYHNEETGVYCSFEYYESEGDNEDIEIEQFGSFEDTNFAFNINFIRPQFFGSECFPLVDSLVEDLNLYILNPQGESEIPEKYEKGILEEEWAKTNLSFVKSNFQRFELNFLEIDKSNYSWRFCFNRNKLQEQFGVNYFVPGIFYIKEKNTNMVSTMCVWPEHIPIVIPLVDFVLVQRRRKRFLKTIEENGIISFKDIMKNLGTYFEKRENYLILHPHKSNLIAKAFNKLPLIGSFERFGEGVEVEKIVNIK